MITSIPQARVSSADGQRLALLSILIPLDDNALSAPMKLQQEVLLSSMMARSRSVLASHWLNQWHIQQFYDTYVGPEMVPDKS